MVPITAPLRWLVVGLWGCYQWLSWGRWCCNPSVWCLLGHPRFSAGAVIGTIQAAAPFPLLMAGKDPDRMGAALGPWASGSASSEDRSSGG